MSTEHRVYHDHNTGRITVAQDPARPLAVCEDVVTAQRIADALNLATTSGPRVGDTVTTDNGRFALMQYVAEEAAPVVITGSDGWRPYILTEDEDGTCWAWSWHEEGEDRPNVRLLDLPLPYTVRWAP